MTTSVDEGQGVPNLKNIWTHIKRDGLNHRRVNLVIDGKPYTAVVLTGINLDSTDADFYGENFYDITHIEPLNEKIRAFLAYL